MQIIYCISFIGLFSARTLQRIMGQILSQLLPTCESAQVPALPTGTLRVDQTTTRKQLNTKGMQTEIKDTWQVGQKPPAIWKQHTAPLRPRYKSRRRPSKKKKRNVSNVHLSRERFVRTVNTHFGTHSSENMREDFPKAGQFCQLCEATHGVLLPGDSSSTETSTGSGPRPLHGGLLWSLPKI